MFGPPALELAVLVLRDWHSRQRFVDALGGLAGAAHRSDDWCRKVPLGAQWPGHRLLIASGCRGGVYAAVSMAFVVGAVHPATCSPSTAEKAPCARLCLLRHQAKRGLPRMTQRVLGCLRRTPLRSCGAYGPRLQLSACPSRRTHGCQDERAIPARVEPLEEPSSAAPAAGKRRGTGLEASLLLVADREQRRRLAGSGLAQSSSSDAASGKTKEGRDDG